jgi:FAD synthetase
MDIDACERLLKYIQNFKESLKTLKILDSSAEEVVSLAIDYFKDSQYYLEKGDCITGLITISYAEGLLDALKNVSAIDIKWVKAPETIVLATGSFDIIHPGHIEYLKWASSLGDKLFVIVSRDVNYRRFKGFDPVFNEVERLRIVESIRYVYKAFLGSEKDIFESVAKIKPSIIALGYDQPDPSYIVEELKVRGLHNVKILRMGSKIGGYSSTSIKSRICRDWCRDVQDKTL